MRQAQSAVLDAAKRVLPQQRRSQMLAEAKRAGLAAARERRRARGHHGTGAGAGDGCSSDEEEDGEDELAFSDVPDEVTRVILASLDPVSLGRAACACRAWREMVLADGQMWSNAVASVFGRRGEARVAATEAAARAAAAAAAAPLAGSASEGHSESAAAAAKAAAAGTALGGLDGGGGSSGCGGAEGNGGGQGPGAGAGAQLSRGSALSAGDLAALFAALAAGGHGSALAVVSSVSWRGHA